MSRPGCRCSTLVRTVRRGGSRLRTTCLRATCLRAPCLRGTDRVTARRPSGRCGAGRPRGRRCAGSAARRDGLSRAVGGRRHPVARTVADRCVEPLPGWARRLGRAVGTARARGVRPGGTGNATGSAYGLRFGFGGRGHGRSSLCPWLRGTKPERVRGELGSRLGLAGRRGAVFARQRQRIGRVAVRVTVRVAVVRGYEVERQRRKNRARCGGRLQISGRRGDRRGVSFRRARLRRRRFR